MAGALLRREARGAGDQEEAVQAGHNFLMADRGQAGPARQEALRSRDNRGNEAQPVRIVQVYNWGLRAAGGTTDPSLEA